MENDDFFLLSLNFFLNMLIFALSKIVKFTLSTLVKKIAQSKNDDDEHDEKKAVSNPRQLFLNAGCFFNV